MELFVLINRPGFTTLSGSRVLKHSDALEVIQASKLIAQAKEYADCLQQKAQTALEDERLQAYKTGLLQAEQEWASKLAAAEAARYVTINDLAPTLVNLVVDAVSVVLRRADPLQVMDAAFIAVGDLLRQSRWARLKVHPSEVDAVRSVIEKLALKVGTGAQIVTVVGDPTSELHACVFETDVGIADAGLDVQLRAIRAAVETALSELMQKKSAGRTLTQEVE
jgi:type III secretion protein L